MIRTIYKGTVYHFQAASVSPEEEEVVITYKWAWIDTQIMVPAEHDVNMAAYSVAFSKLICYAASSNVSIEGMIQMANEENEALDFSVDRGNLYKEESFTDLKACSIRRLTPIKADGTLDKSRKTIFVGQTTLMTPNGAVPLQDVIQAKELPQAFKKFPDAMQSALSRLIEEAKQMKEQEEDKSRIIVPGR